LTNKVNGETAKVAQDIKEKIHQKDKVIERRECPNKI